MDRTQRPSGPPLDDGLGNGPGSGRGASKLPWILAGWLVLSALAVVGALVLNRAPQSASAQHALPALDQPADTIAAQNPAPAAQPPADGSSDWTLHLIYTAVEKYYGGSRVRVTGCSTSTCLGRRADLGRFPSSFLAAVKNEGTGLISSGRYAHKYLNWDAQAGFWLDTAARGFGSAPLRPFASARTESPLLPLGTRLRITVCGPSSRQGTGAMCTKLRSVSWSVTTTGQPAAARDVWLYVGVQRRPRGGPWSGSFHNAILRIG